MLKIQIQIIEAAVLIFIAPRHQSFASARADKENEVKTILERIEKETLEFRDEIERAYSERCTIDTLSRCNQNSFNGCSSIFPNQQCMKADELVIEACAGSGGNCNALWDKTTSVVSIPEALAKGEHDNPTDPEIIETACYTLLAEDYMRQKYENDEIFWDSYNVQPSWTYFGAHNGLFRKLPANAQEECGNYDPRLRPWFVAASSGPKDVVLVLDVSGSMSDHGRLDLAKEAAITVIDTLTISDRVAVIVFSDYASQVPMGTEFLLRATSENKKLLIDSIRELTEGGSTNFHDGFKHAFDALERTIAQEYTSGCNIAILFMTDGVRTAGPETDEVMHFIDNSAQRLASVYGRDTKIFTFSLGVTADRLATKEIACKANGIWTPVDDFDGDLVGAMASYYKLFALGLGNYTDFNAWVEPYEFFSAKKMGTTNSAPVFDRSVDPPLFLGVVANDVYLDAFEQVLEEDAHSSTMLQRFVRLSAAQCPNIDLSDCQVEYLRYLAGGDEATCGTCNFSEYPGIIPTECPFKPDLPKNLWQNTDMEGLEYNDRACCESGNDEPSEVCSTGYFEPPVAHWFVTAFIIPVVLFVLFPCCIVFFVRKHRKRDKQPNTIPTATSVQGEVSLVPSSIPIPVPVPSTTVPVAVAVPSTRTLSVASIVSLPDDIVQADDDVVGKVAQEGEFTEIPPSAPAPMPPPVNPTFDSDIEYRREDRVGAYGVREG